MKSRLLVVIIVVLALMLPALAVSAQEEEPAPCAIVGLFDGWARATVEGAPTGAAFGVLVNLGAETDTLISASTPAAEVVELHEIVMGMGDVMQMRPLEGGFVVPAGGYTELKPGGLHIMLINLVEPLLAGKILELTLTFEVAGDVEVMLPIREMAVMGEMAMGGGMMMPEESMPMAPAAEWDEACRTIHIVDAWMRPAGDGMPTSAAYMLLLNLTDSEDTLVSVATEAAMMAELHTMTLDDEQIMRMRPVEGGIPVPAQGTAILKPGGLHIMLMGLTGVFAVGDEVPFTLTFAEAGDFEIVVPVREPMLEGMEMEMEMGDMED